MKKENRTKYCFLGCPEASKWYKENENLINDDSCILCDDSDYYFLHKMKSNLFVFDYESGDENKTVISWEEFKQLLLEDYKMPFKNILIIPDSIHKYCFYGCQESEQWSSEEIDGIENSFSPLSRGYYYWISSISISKDYIFDFNAENILPEGLQLISWAQYKNILLNNSFAYEEQY